MPEMYRSFEVTFYRIDNCPVLRSILYKQNITIVDIYNKNMNMIIICGFISGHFRSFNFFIEKLHRKKAVNYSDCL